MIPARHMPREKGIVPTPEIRVPVRNYGDPTARLFLSDIESYSKQLLCAGKTIQGRSRKLSASYPGLRSPRLALLAGSRACILHTHRAQLNVCTTPSLQATKAVTLSRSYLECELIHGTQEIRNQ